MLKLISAFVLFFAFSPIGFCTEKNGAFEAEIDSVHAISDHFPTAPGQPKGPHNYLYAIVKLINGTPEKMTAPPGESIVCVRVVPVPWELYSDSERFLRPRHDRDPDFFYWRKDVQKKRFSSHPDFFRRLRSLPESGASSQSGFIQ